MIVKLRVLHGKLQNRRGENAGLEVKVRGPRFIIGSAPDSSMCCRSRTISPHHCEIRVEDQEAIVRDLGSETGTYLNEQRLQDGRALTEGDRLRVGRLEFEVLIDRAAPSRSPRRASGGEPKADPVAEFVSELLVEADEEDRARRMEDPESRHFQLPQGPSRTPDGEETTREEKTEETKRIKRPPPKKPPGKLPPPPPVVADTTVEAAEETLKKLFARDNKRPTP